MDRAEMMTAYEALAEPRRSSFLAHVALELTLLARGTYAVGSETVDDPVRLRAINECQHQVTQHLRHLLEGQRSRYPEDLFGGMIFEAASELGFERRLGELLAEAASTSATFPKRSQSTGRVA